MTADFWANLGAFFLVLKATYHVFVNIKVSVIDSFLELIPYKMTTTINLSKHKPTYNPVILTDWEQWFDVEVAESHL